MQTNELRDDIDFARGDISQLFRQMFFPTLLGMLFTAMFIITDGVFVGRGLGSNALAAVNIVAPLFMISTGVGLLFGMGGSILASIHLAEKKAKVARIVCTQAALAPSLIMIISTLLVLFYAEELLLLLGSSVELLPLCRGYLWGFVPFLLGYTLMNSLSFFVRLNGKPRFAMLCAIVASVVNVILDYLLIFVFEWGVFGAAFATGIGTSLGVIMLLASLFDTKNQLYFERLKLSAKSFKMSLRNVWYMSRLGGASLIGEAAISLMLIVGNIVFIDILGEDGVAAYSVCCYLYPLIFMLNTSISQSAQPIISFNHTLGEAERSRRALRVAFRWAAALSVAIIAALWIGAPYIIAMFLSPEGEAFAIAVYGVPLFALGFLPFAVNMISIGYFQSTSRTAQSIIAITLRGFLLMLLSFYILPKVWGATGAWLAVPMAEILTMIYLGLALLFKRK